MPLNCFFNQLNYNIIIIILSRTISNQRTCKGGDGERGSFVFKHLVIPIFLSSQIRAKFTCNYKI